MATALRRCIRRASAACLPCLPPGPAGISGRTVRLAPAGSPGTKINARQAGQRHIPSAKTSLTDTFLPQSVHLNLTAIVLRPKRSMRPNGAAYPSRPGAKEQIASHSVAHLDSAPPHTPQDPIRRARQGESLSGATPAAAGPTSPPAPMRLGERFGGNRCPHPQPWTVGGAVAARRKVLTSPSLRVTLCLAGRGGPPAIWRQAARGCGNGSLFPFGTPVGCTENTVSPIAQLVERAAVNR